MKLITLLLLIVGSIAQLIVDLPLGQIRGHELLSFTNKSYLAFEGIPFAKPPLGNLRFQAPEPMDKWNGTLDTTELKHCCYSVTLDFERENEDCLHLNVFTPIIDRMKNVTKLPVVFWIYGGGFINGCADWWPQYWMDEDIVVVIANYRVGPFGFLATGDMSAPGNAGLKDQSLALQWTFDNVELFGGDKERITIAGQSAGGSSVGWQLLNNEVSGLFKGAIIESGSPMNTWAFNNNPEDYARSLANTINSSLPDLSTADLVLYLQSLDPKIIDNASTGISKTSLPVIEPVHPNAFITEPMYELFSVGNYTTVPMIVGVNSEEKITLAANIDTLKKYAASADANLGSLVPANFNFKSNITSLEVGEEIRRVYVGNSTLESNLGKYIRLSSENQYTRSVIEQGQLMAKFNDVYFYIFSYDGIAGGHNETFPDADSVAHAEELKYNWSTLPLDQLDEPDRLTHMRMMKLWTNFVKYLNPTPTKDELLQDLVWEKVNLAYNFLNINASLSLEMDPKGDYFIGWSKIFDTYAKRPYKTY